MSHRNWCGGPELLGHLGDLHTGQGEFFSWLLYNDRLTTRSNLLHKRCLQPDEAFCPRCPSTIEDKQHWPSATFTWEHIGVSVPAAHNETSWCVCGPQGLPVDVRNDTILVLHWRIWSARNNMVFNTQDDESTAILRLVAEDLYLWRHRCKNPEKQRLIDDWKEHVKLVVAASTPT